MKKQKSKSPWYMKKPDILNELTAGLKLEFPNLHVLIDDLANSVVIVGTLPILLDNKEVDRYKIRIQLDDNHPYSPPLVFETGGRIPRVIDRHINSNNTLCLGMAEETWPDKDNPLDLCKFIDGPVKSFLVGNSLFERERSWPHGERKHGAEGILEFYSEVLGFNDPNIIYNFLECLSNPVVKGHWHCPCGQLNKLRNCHYDLVLSVRKKYPLEAIQYSYNEVKKYKSMGLLG